jgi:hypothetical protein
MSQPKASLIVKICHAFFLGQFKASLCFRIAYRILSFGLGYLRTKGVSRHQQRRFFPLDSF